MAASCTAWGHRASPCSTPADGAAAADPRFLIGTLHLRDGETGVAGHGQHLPRIAERVGHVCDSRLQLAARQFRLANPDVRLELTFLTSPAQRDRILQDEIDFGFIVGAFQNSEIESRLIARHSLVALMPPGHPLTARPALTIEDLAGEQLVMGTHTEWPSFRRIVVDAFQSAGQVMTVGQEASSLTGLLGLVTAGVGITTAPVSLPIEGIVPLKVAGYDFRRELGLLSDPAWRTLPEVGPRLAHMLETIGAIAAEWRRTKVDAMA